MITDFSRYIALLLLLTLNVSVSNAQKDSSDFVFTVNTALYGGSNDSTFEIRIQTNYGFDFDIDWNNDGVFDSLNMGQNYKISHQYPASGIYTIRIRGHFPKPTFGTGSIPDRLKIISLDQWGDQVWESLDHAFSYCYNLVYHATDTPDLSQVTNIGHLFEGVTTFNADISGWDVSSVENMEHAFTGTSLNCDINTWDVSKVKNMSGLFLGTPFNKALNDWDVSSVVTMRGMFAHSNFNSDITDWDVSNVKNMDFMFFMCTPFNQDLSNWNVSSVESMLATFQETSFNYDINSWDVSSVVNFSQMFEGCPFNHDLDNWNVSSAESMVGMFRKNEEFNGNISTWDVTNLKYSQYMFYEASAFNNNIEDWNTDSLVVLTGMFSGAGNFNQNLGLWSIDSVKYMNYLFDNSAMSTCNYDSTIISWQAKKHPKSIKIGVLGIKYCTSNYARKQLMSDGWEFIGDAESCKIPCPNGTPLSKLSINIFPNPAHDYLNIEFNREDYLLSIELYNSNGELVRKAWPYGKVFKLDLNDLSNGIYLIKAGSFEKKVIVSK